jgi:hypothetical protein
MPRFRPAFGAASPGGVIVTTDGISQAVAIPAGSQGFWIHMSAAGFVKVTATATVINPMNDENSAPLASGMLYGPFEFASSGSDRYVHVAGSGGTPTATITFV